MSSAPVPAASGEDLALAAASAAAAVLPSVEPLIAAAAQPGNEHVTAVFSGAAIAELEGSRAGRIAVLVGDELTDALASSPLEGLDLAAAAQPAIDAIAAVLGGSARAARTVALDLVVSDLGPAFTVVPLIGAGIAESVLIQDHLLDGAPASVPVPEVSAAQPVDVVGGQVNAAEAGSTAGFTAPHDVPGLGSTNAPGTGGGTVTPL